MKDCLYWNKGSAAFRAQRVNCVLQQRGEELVSGDWRLGNLAPKVEPILYLFKPYDVGTTITDQFLSSGLGCFNADYHKENVVEVSSKIAEKLHETQKPEELMQILINLVTQKGHVVTDPFMGSGTTGVACVNTGRKFIGIEMDEGYFNVAKERILGANYENQ